MTSLGWVHLLITLFHNQPTFIQETTEKKTFSTSVHPIHPAGAFYNVLA